MSHHQPKPCTCCSDLALAGALLLVALSGFSIAATIVTSGNPQPTWLLSWCQLPTWIKFVPASIVGLAISVGIGSWFVERFDHCAGAKLRKEGADEWNKASELYVWQDQKDVPRCLTGCVERFAFTFIVIFYPTLALAAMGGWLGLKMAAQWNKDIMPKDGIEHAKAKIVWNRFAFLGLLTGFVSLFIAWVGGALARLIMGLTVGS